MNHPFAEAPESSYSEIAVWVAAVTVAYLPMMAMIINN